ncbi:MAG TPA: YEATS-associated helix-containing protein [Myxococcaceae bacterium]|nr:YEATS-associated helix-containing protein [Myxococcaceae bacterium]
MDTPWWFSLLKALVCLLWSTLAIVLLRAVWRWARGTWMQVRDNFGPDGLRTIALVCACVLFMGTVPRFIELPLRLAYSTVLASPLRVLEGPPQQAAAGDAVAQTAVAQANELSWPQVLANTAKQLLSGLTHDLTTFQAELPYVQLMFFLLAWFVVGQVLRVAFPAQGDGQSENAQAFSRVIREIGFTRSVLVVLLVLGLALCVASITAVSELQDTTDVDNPVQSSKELEERIKAAQDPFAKEVYPYTPDADKDPDKLVTQEIAKPLPATATAQEAAEAERARRHAEGLVNSVAAARSQLKQIFQNLIDRTSGRYDRATQDALTEYHVASSTRHGSREQRQHFLAIVQWHQDSRFKLRSAIEKCKQSVIDTEAKWNEALSHELLLLKVGGNKLPALENPYERMLKAKDGCALASVDRPPARADFGAALGPLKPIAGWLLQTESIQLALIIGMLGAGLLGSAVATFLRGEGQKEPTEEQLASVVVRGMTAAIVVFLAAQGGLSTISANGPSTPRPNPYVLLLICFVAAVYSEQVWTAALSRLKKQLGQDGEKKAEDDSAPARSEPATELQRAEPAPQPQPTSAVTPGGS